MVVFQHQSLTRDASDSSFAVGDAASTTGVAQKSALNRAGTPRRHVHFPKQPESQVYLPLHQRTDLEYNQTWYSDFDYCTFKANARNVVRHALSQYQKSKTKKRGMWSGFGKKKQESATTATELNATSPQQQETLSTFCRVLHLMYTACELAEVGDFDSATNMEKRQNRNFVRLFQHSKKDGVSDETILLELIGLEQLILREMTENAEDRRIFLQVTMREVQGLYDAKARKASSSYQAGSSSSSEEEDAQLWAVRDERDEELRDSCLYFSHASLLFARNVAQTQAIINVYHDS
eukprot:CAMPEP_0172449900 /NCGR_PEP_ID=MMETSP1065-20121228/8475_1 /TAXON_ID=265537 /ORGANISM="Amphiprora paludosa, Strain CCMP125" /LENGTH=292 /DNA_ID=CAMNT_0013201657 /DNA_START=196 /DNA_END=1074 /DNA_ORIENTATION=+